MPITPFNRTNMITLLRERCRFDHRLTLMMLGALLADIADEDLVTMVEFAQEWRISTKESQVDTFNNAMKSHFADV